MDSPIGCESDALEAVSERKTSDFKYDTEFSGHILTPFTYQCEISRLQYIKMYLLTVIILPFRAVAVGSLFIVTLLLSNLFTLGYDVKSQLKPVCDFRRWLLLPIVVLFARFVFFLGGFHWITFRGTRASRKEAPILVVAPHSSFFDSLVVVALGMPSVVGKTESAESFVGGFFKVLQPVLVDREDPDSRKKAIQELNRRAKSKDDWPQIVIFPEGTCTNRSCIASFKAGAFNAGVPVQPVIVRWPNQVDSVTWVCEGPSVLKLLWLTMTQFYNRLEIEFLPVYQPNEDEQLDAQLYADNIRRIMAGYLNVPLCDLSYDDFCQIRIACRYKLPTPEAVVYLNSLLQMMFSLELNRDATSEEDQQSDWFQARLNSMLDICRNKPYLSRSEFIETLFPTSRPNSKAMYLINLVSKHYSEPLSNTVNFRMCMIHGCMLLFTASPSQAFHYSSKVYSPVNVTGKNELQEWEISKTDAAELLKFAFDIKNHDTVQRILDHAYQIRDSALSTSHEKSNGDGVSGQYLYEGMLGQLPDLANCYVHYDADVRRVFKGRRRPLIESSSTSENNLNEVTSASLSRCSSSARTTPNLTDNRNATDLRDNLLTNNFECIEISDIPSCEILNSSDESNDTTNSHTNKQNVKFRGRIFDRHK
ncbi:unnamed protein product [Trichobilharzia szidati]|nr:unnamed protein product [Trichobilharzia szidati]